MSSASLALLCVACAPRCAFRALNRDKGRRAVPSRAICTTGWQWQAWHLTNGGRGGRKRQTNRMDGGGKYRSRRSSSEVRIGVFTDGGNSGFLGGLKSAAARDDNKRHMIVRAKKKRPSIPHLEEVTDGSRKGGRERIKFAPMQLRTRFLP